MYSHSCFIDAISSFIFENSEYTSDFFFQIIISISIDVYSDFLDFPPSTSLDIPFGFSIPRTFHKWLNCKGAETVN